MSPTTHAAATFHGNDVTKQFIAGQWRDGAAGTTKQDVNPYDDAVVAEFALASEADLDEAYRAAADAQKEWAAVAPAKRAAVLRRAAELLEERRAEIVDWLVKESGSTVIKANIEVSLAAGITQEAASFPSRVHGTIHPSNTPDREMRVYRKPVGVVGVISPWNFPLHLSQRSVAPALPAGVLSVVVGAGSEIGDAFVKHPVPRLISFTGSTPVGKQVGANAVSGDHIKKVALELGGNAPVVVLDDADLDAAVEQSVTGGYLHSGQICMSVQRVIVDEKVYDEFLPKYEGAVKSLKFGGPREEGVLVGPVVNDQQLETLKKKIASAEADGARALVSGEIEGRVVPPFLWVDAEPGMEIARDEIFGPMTVVLKARDEAHALELANDHEFGLSSAVFTQDLDRGLRFADGLAAGMSFINEMTVQDEAHVAFGGARNSGLGRFNGEWAIEEFTTAHTIGVKRLG